MIIGGYDTYATLVLWQKLKRFDGQSLVLVLCRTQAAFTITSCCLHTKASISGCSTIPRQEHTGLACHLACASFSQMCTC